MITVGQITQVTKALSAINWNQVASMNLGDMASDEVLAEDILSIVAVFWPPAALLAEALVVAVAVGPLVNIHITPDPDPVHDAQTSLGRGGRNA